MKAKRSIVLYIGMVIIMLCSFAGCTDNNYAKDCVIISVKDEYRQKFGEKGFRVDDFTWDNVKEIKYNFWYENDPNFKGTIVVYLKKTGEKQVLEAIEHFKQLDFVLYAEVRGFGYALN